MKKLAERTDFIIKNVNKGGTVVIMDTNDEADCQLREKDNYKQLPNDPTLQT